MDAFKDALHTQLAQLRTKLDDIPALQKLEVSFFRGLSNVCGG